MTREYKDMQEFLIKKNNELEEKIQQLQDEMGLSFFFNISSINFYIHSLK